MHTQTMQWIKRTHRGDLLLPARTDASIPPHVLTTFRHACDVFAYLIERGERITPLDWCERIENRYAPHHRRARVTAAIKACMLDAPPVDLASLGAPVRMLCACCAGVTLGRQWHNQDTGHGICARCIDWQAARGEKAEDLARRFGVRGVHFDINETEEA